MVALRAKRRKTKCVAFGFAIACFLLAPPRTRSPNPAPSPPSRPSPAPISLIPSPFGAVRLAVLSYPEPVGTAIPAPPDAGLPREKHDWVAVLPGLVPVTRGDLPVLKEPELRVASLSVPTAEPPVESARGEMSTSSPVLGPFAHARFCLQYPADCQTGVRPSDRSGFVLNAARWGELAQVNREVNRSIRPQRNGGGIMAERWLVWPTAGDCNDYAVTKRHALLKRGWPSNVLLLAEALTPSGEHHLVLVVHARNGEFVLDNMTDSILTYARVRYQWLRVQSPRNPKFWFAVKQFPA
jgi:predicted transglutaminase-like cysteine proteinase